MDKRHPGVARMYKRVMQEYEQGRNTSISTEELERWARRYLPEHFVSEFDLLKRKAYALAAHLVEAVVESEVIKSMDPARQEILMQALLDFNPFIQYIYVTDREGRKSRATSRTSPIRPSMKAPRWGKIFPTAHGLLNP